MRVDGATLESAASYDFEDDNQLTIRVRATDRAGESLEKTLTISVTDANDAPVAVDDLRSTTEDTRLDLPVSGATEPGSQRHRPRTRAPLTVSR